jgi:hypothetical protein
LATIRHYEQQQVKLVKIQTLEKELGEVFTGPEVILWTSVPQGKLVAPTAYDWKESS